SIDFHAGELAPDQPMRTIAPGESLTYEFTATHSGAWLYHCATMPMSRHIANGIFGAVIIDPPNLPNVDREYFMVQSELYLGSQGGVVDADKVAREEADAVVFNGFANQYDHDPIRAKVGERVRIWVVDAGPNRPSAFHIIGGQFDTVFKEGAYRLKRGNAEKGASQTLALAASQGGFVELELAEAGHYPSVNHSLADAERGAHGVVQGTHCPGRGRCPGRALRAAAVRRAGHALAACAGPERRRDGAERSRSGRCVSAFRVSDSQILQSVESVLQVVVLSKMSAQARPGKAVPSAWRTAAAKGVSVISQSALSTVRETLPVVGSAIGDITPIFYKRMFTARPDLLRDLFNRGNQAQGEQQKALAGAIAAYASLLVSDDAPNIDAMMSRIANKHASLGITEDQYPIVYEHLFAAIGEVLGDAATPEVVDPWTAVYWDVADALIEAEKELYARHDVAPGDAWRDLVVTRRRQESPNTVSLVLSRPDGGVLPQAQPGQYVSVQVQLPDGANQIRQYSLTKATGRTSWTVTI